MRHAVIVRIGADGKPSAQYYHDAGQAKDVFRASAVAEGEELQLWRTGRAKPRIKRAKGFVFDAEEETPTARPVTASPPKPVPTTQKKGK